MSLKRKLFSLSVKQPLKHVLIYPFMLVMMMFSQLSAQQYIDGEEMEVLEHKIVVQNSHEAVWNALVEFGNVSNFHSSFDDSVSLNGTNELAQLGVEREVQIPDGINNIINKERIITFMDGVYYTFEVYESENFPTKKMHITYGVRLDEKGRTILFVKTFYKLNNAINTRFLKRKLNRLGMDSLLAYKYYIETGERNTDLKILRKRYQKEGDGFDPDYLAISHPKK